MQCPQLSHCYRVSTHDLTKRSTKFHYFVSSHFSFQLTTSRRGRPQRIFYNPFNGNVSTHDLTKRSTPSNRTPVGDKIVSTHDLTKRSTECSRYYSADCIVSTHDLTKRSTAWGKEKSPRPEFQLTTSRRGRPEFSSVLYPCTLFQLTTSRRGRHAACYQLPIYISFNSRPHEEVDVLLSPSGSSAFLFQLTTSRRGRPGKVT